jgi:hypothetical protein
MRSPPFALPKFRSRLLIASGTNDEAVVVHVVEAIAPEVLLVVGVGVVAVAVVAVAVVAVAVVAVAVVAGPVTWVAVVGTAVDNEVLVDVAATVMAGRTTAPDPVVHVSVGCVELPAGARVRVQSDVRSWLSPASTTSVGTEMACC